MERKFGQKARGARGCPAEGSEASKRSHASASASIASVDSAASPPTPSPQAARCAPLLHHLKLAFRQVALSFARSLCGAHKLLHVRHAAAILEVKRAIFAELC